MLPARWSSSRVRRWSGRAVGLLACLAFVSMSEALDEEPPPPTGSGHLVNWEGWSFRWHLRQRTGLVLTEISFRGRRVLKYAGLEEIFVPYDQGQPRPEDSLDGMGGKNLVELQRGKDCLPGTVCQMFDANGQQEGKPLVAMHEESSGTVYLGDLGRASGKSLVIWAAARLSKYTYFMRWRFSTDGTFSPEAGLTGRLEHTRPGEESHYGSLVQRNPETFAPSHVHNFYYRLDFDIDGPEDDLLQEFQHRQEVPGQSNASRDTWVNVSTESARSLSSGTFRRWRVMDKVSRNKLGLPRSYDIAPFGGVFRGAATETFAQGDLWVTKYRRNELPFSRPDPRPIREALPSYVNGEAVDGTDLVVWYAMHIHHKPRTEDWPAMPVEWVGFQVMPRDFLDSSPLRPGN